ncbi:hypothetical protein EJ05DRAFT_479265 [Pseudovirgaria hyperparasitica]|uniref:Uncharacterized protein n=1 Tax=Pseudovirgaria hyperparasitica TaxID=470096 RepID=A0A6A6VXA1_9PEZI|nr:uncharacterized protein EJ05DRAFT_479265 [Pseudovirgaria hyperparasitica]KAF2754853.1 hypothetical protein EJ05DRAFT_479265 [Pseudovirgaria hyperparasitica]
MPLLPECLTAVYYEARLKSLPDDRSLLSAKDDPSFCSEPRQLSRHDPPPPPPQPPPSPTGLAFFESAEDIERVALPSWFC